MADRVLGCIVQPLIEVQPISPLLAAAKLPDAYIVPAFRHLFDDNFNVIPSEAEKFIKDQGQRPSCVGQATSYQKEAEEGVRMSGNDIYRQAKRLDGFGDPLSYGTTLAAGQDAVKNGVCRYDLAPEVSSMKLDEYVNSKPTEEQLADRKNFKGKDYFRVTRNEFRQTLFQFQLPIVTSMSWYLSDDNVDSTGVIGFPKGQSLGGHAIDFIGWRANNDIIPNSFGPRWADNGFFHAPLNIRARFGDGLVSIDMPSTLTELLLKFDGQNVKVPDDPNVWRIMLGVKRRFPDEITLWAQGYIFSELQGISAEDLAVIPEGPEMTIDDAPFKTRELVREIRMSVGLK